MENFDLSTITRNELLCLLTKAKDAIVIYNNLLVFRTSL